MLFHIPVDAAQLQHAQKMVSLLRSSLTHTFAISFDDVFLCMPHSPRDLNFSQVLNWMPQTLSGHFG